MNRGVKFLSCSALLLVSACIGDGAKLELRALPTPLAQGKQPVSVRVAEANAQMALGNVALALEAYRKAAREDPASIAALAGIAACYDRMGRFDLSRRHYEAALSIDPDNGTILAMLAASLDQQGLRSEAGLVRRELHQRRTAAARASTPLPEVAAAAKVAAAPAAPAIVARAAAPPVELAMPTPRTMPLPAVTAAPLAASLGVIAPVAVVAAFAPDPEPEPAPAPKVMAKPVAMAAAPSATPTAKPAVAPAANAPVELAMPAPRAAPLPTITAAPLAASLGVIAPVAVAAAFAPEAEPLPAPDRKSTPEPVALAEISAPARSVTVTLPPPRPAGAPPVAVSEQPKPEEQPRRVPSPDQVPVRMAQNNAPAQPVRPMAGQMVAAGPGPRLERLSLGEVALVTRGESRWASLIVKKDQRSATVRFVPLRQANVRFASVRLLNAARVRGLAAQSRATLLGRGWRGIAIGDAAGTRRQSLVLYPAHRRLTALSLARQFGIKATQRATGREITVLLGRDAAVSTRRSPTA